MLQFIKMGVYTHLKLICLQVCRGQVDTARTFIIPYLATCGFSGAIRCIYQEIDDTMENMRGLIGLQSMFRIQYPRVKSRTFQRVEVLEKAHGLDSEVRRNGPDALALQPILDLKEILHDSTRGDGYSLSTTLRVR